ncbi:carboxypeptidase regulatory-like domain-containing protein [Salinicoccus roseus]|uniref:carboxypeptidase regulatory-like domain-containing protein n=1 Tax=Salinicoccus roseus TaxID=45670 RepID=UPI0023016403|nr:carboxypeptidase regulatory-like domain-containing protein [Salinicoccus roseus]
MAADTVEEPTQEDRSEESEVVGESTSEPSMEEEYTNEYYEEWTEETYDYVPPQTEETYEEWTEESYEDSYEPEPTVEQTVEPTVEEFTQEVIEEPAEAPTEEPAVEMEPVEEPVNVEINQSEVTEFSIEGKVMADAKGVADVTVSLSGEKEDEAVTDAEGEFQFPEVPAGDYTLEIDVPEEYEADEADRTLTVDDKGKKGIIFDLAKKDEPQAEGLEPEERVSAGENVEEPGMNTMLVIMGSVLLMLGLLIYAIRLLRNR